jgi:YVTN family beta-propeller protein
MVLREVDPQFGAGRDALATGANGRAGVDLFSERGERIGVDGDTVWLTNAGATSASASGVSTGGTLRRISARSGRVEETLPMGRVKELLIDGGSIWVGEIGGITRMNLVTGTTDRISLPTAAVPNGIASGHGSIWVATGPLVRGTRVIGSGALTRIDPSANAVVATIPLGGTPRGVATTEDGVWVTDRATSRVLRIDPSTNRVAQKIRLGNPPDDIVAADGVLWVAMP